MLQFGYIGLTILMVLIILYGYNYSLKKNTFDIQTRKKKLFTVTLGLTLWFVYLFLISKTKFLQSFELPPRFPIFLIFPTFIFTSIVLYKHRKSTVISAIPKSWLIYYQSFRIIIESLFVATVAIGILHPEVTFEGYNYDIIFGASAPIIGFLLFNKKILSEKFALVWNYIGLAVITFIIFLFTTTTYIPSFWGSTESLANPEFITFPYILVPAFLMPSAVFMHIVSIIQLSNKNL